MLPWAIHLLCGKIPLHSEQEGEGGPCCPGQSCARESTVLILLDADVSSATHCWGFDVLGIFLLSTIKHT